MDNSMDYVFSQYQESADYLRSRLNGFTPDIVMVLGSGLGFLGDKVEDPTVIPYGDIPHFKVSTAPGHMPHSSVLSPVPWPPCLN